MTKQNTGVKRVGALKQALQGKPGPSIPTIVLKKAEKAKERPGNATAPDQTLKKLKR